MLRNGLEPWHLAIVVLVCLMLFGSKKLPEMARGLGRSARILKSEARALREETPAPQAQAQTPAPAPAPADH
ncbi:Sec-independent protein translocase subunit TatA [Streptomyces sp. NPDC003952]